ncbi:MAG: hypothetical protein AB7F19_02030 [Candidatus Babeliales bacterium]
MKRRIVMAIALAGLIGAIVVHKVKPEQVQDPREITIDAVEFVQTESPLRQLMQEGEVKIEREADLAEETILPEACVIPVDQMPLDDDLLVKEEIEAKITEQTPLFKLEEEKIMELEKVSPIITETPELTQSVEATPLPAVQTAPAVVSAEPRAVTGRFGGGKFF